MLDINFDQSQLDKETQTILNASTSNQAEILKQAYNVINKLAISFNDTYINVTRELEIFENDLKNIIKSWHNFKASCLQGGVAFKDTNEYDEYLKNRAQVRSKIFSNEMQQKILNMTSLAMKFQQYINAALGQKVATAYVWVNTKGIPETYIIHDMSQFLKTDIDRYGNIIVRYKNNAELLRNHTQKIQNLIKQDSINFEYSILKSTYKTAFDRYHRYPIKKGGSFILWLYPYGGQKWNGVYVSSFGSINEAYATLLLHEHFNPTDTPEDNMEQFMSAVIGVTNLSGTLQGDTTVGQMQVAIKSKNATTLSIEQLYNIAQGLIKNKFNNFSEIKNYLINIKMNNKNVQQQINKSLKESLRQITDQYVNEKEVATFLGAV